MEFLPLMVASLTPSDLPDSEGLTLEFLPLMVASLTPPDLPDSEGLTRVSANICHFVELGGTSAGIPGS